MEETIRKVSVSDQVYDVIKKSILDFKRKPGTKLNVDELCKQYGLSNTPIREAIKRLQQDGYVEQRVNAGFFVSSISHEESKNYSGFIKTVLIGSIEELVHEGRIDDIVALLEEQLNIQKKILVKKDSIRYLRAAIQFDEIFIRSLNNKVLTDCIERMNEMFSFSVYAFHKKEENQLKSLEDHQNMIDAIKNGEYELLKNLIRQHYDFGTSEELY